MLMSNTEYYDGFTENDLQFRTRGNGADMSGYLEFAKDQVMDFTEKQKTMIDKAMKQIETTVRRKGYRLPQLDEIVFICTTMKEEGDLEGERAIGYTHKTQVYMNGKILDNLIKDKERTSRWVYLLSHELFHCLTRFHPDFRAEMYDIIHFAIQEEDYDIPPAVLEYLISNPDVEHHDACAAFKINGKMVDCYMAFITKEHFTGKYSNIFEASGAVLVPTDGSDRFYYPEDAINYDEIFGRNTDYTIDPEECMADNFGFLIAYGEKNNYDTPEIIDRIHKYLLKKTVPDTGVMPAALSA